MMLTGEINPSLALWQQEILLAEKYQKASVLRRAV